MVLQTTVVERERSFGTGRKRDSVSVMIDTITLKHDFGRLDMQRLTSGGFVGKQGRRNPQWYRNPPEESVLPRITISQPPDGRFHVFAEFSMPRLLYGHNAKLPASETEVNSGIEKMCREVEAIIDADFDPRYARIAKVHLTRDYNLGDLANTAAMALFDKRIKYFPIRNLTANNKEPVTLYFNGQSSRRNCVICIYSKYAEVLTRKGSLDEMDAAEGNLRIEYRANNLSGVRSVCKRFDAPKPAELLSMNLNDRVFSFVEKELHFPECIEFRESPLTKLLKFYPSTKAKNLCGFLEMRRLLGDELLTQTANDRRNFNASRRACEKAGIWLDHRQSQE